MLRPAARDRESGMALLAAIILVVLASLVVIAIIGSAMSSRDGARAVQEDAASQEVARTASTVLAAAYSSLDSNEFNGFVPDQATLVRYAAQAGGQVVPNSSLANGLGNIDTARVPAWGQFTVRQPASNGATGYWQVFSVKLPTWGVTRGGRVVVYVRAWTQSTVTKVDSKPIIYRVEMRPGWFADYEMLFDGPISILPGATVNGRIHSNGYQTSFFNQYQAWGNDRLRVSAGVTCSAASRLTTSKGNIKPGACGAQSKANSGPRVNILRARDLANSLRTICETGAHPSVNMLCTRDTTDHNVFLSGSTVTVSGVGSVSAAVTGDRATDKQGAVIVLAGNAHLSGTLGANARAMLVTASAVTGAASDDFGTGQPPSIMIDNGGVVGSGTVATSSFGAVAEGDLLFNERAPSCGVLFRGAIVSMSGLVSINPTWRTPFPTQGGYTCPAAATIQGSIAGHLPPLMNQPANKAGYAVRQYSYLPSLYDNPPPLYPTAADWEVTTFAQADLDCFRSTGSTFTLDTAKAPCI
ncbi:MAG: hypothetical protein JWN72_2040 [Thermoleophilia bacterium]|nr:hypothetical protein [Thermoleophilia bacterium]